MNPSVLLDAALFLGHFHPLLVHLPIGFLILALILEWISTREKYAPLRVAVPISLLAGGIGAILACITGWVLSTNGGYDDRALTIHKWTALTIPFLSLFAWMVSTKRIRVSFLQARRSLLFTLLGLTLILSVAGHMGATLTHGPDYLSMSTLLDTEKKKHAVTSMKEALVFEDLVQPMLDKKCGSCHNSTKMKGGLSMESLRALEKGGKHGAVIVSGQPTASEMVKRISLDPGDKKFMPSDGKPPLSAKEAAVLKWWIEKGAGHADKKWSELADAKSIPADVKNYAQAFFGQPSSGEPGGNADLPVPKVPAVSQATLQKLRRSGFVIKLIDTDPVLLDVTLPPPVKSATTPAIPGNPANPAKTADPDKLKELLAIRDNIIWLNISGNNISDEQMDILGQCKNIRILKLDKTPLTDKGIAKLSRLDQLQSINLYNTKITKNCLVDLSKMKSLKTVYVWGTGIKKEDLATPDSAHLMIVPGSGPAGSPAL
jgi:uncharacterized membrane protein